jgi:EAL domain-containing protein (putative c-di-GMP-specific phosphodiesterase class I)
MYLAVRRWCGGATTSSGPIASVEFIPVAESAGLIDPLTWWVLDEALAQLKCWRQLPPGLVVAIKLSARSLAGTKVPEKSKGRSDSRAWSPPP